MEAMKCPSCGSRFNEPVERCPECKLSLQRLDLKFGMVPRHSRFLSDRAHRLELKEMETLREGLRLFEKKFPQVLLSVLITDLPAGSEAGEYAFWMANRARFSSVEKTGADNFDLLLVIDVISETAALTAGYGLERFVTEEDLAKAMTAVAGPLRKGDFAGAIRACLEKLTRILRERSETARKLEASAA